MKRYFNQVILLTTLSLLLINLILYLLLSNVPINHLTHYDDDNLGSYFHTRMWLSQHKIDYVFIGDSRTKYHVDTLLLNQRGIHAYNAGVSGQFIEIWPSALKNILPYKPKYIILGLSLDDLYHPLHINSARSVGLEDIAMLLDTRQPLTVLLKSVKPVVNASLPMNYFDRIMRQFIGSKQTSFKFNPAIHCNEANMFDYKEGHIMLCDNGDGVINEKISKGDATETLQKIVLQNPDPHTIHYLNTIIKLIKQNDIQPIVILNPYFHKKYEYDPAILKKIDCPVLNFTELFITDKDKANWANGSHFNEKGRQKFTQLLIKKLPRYS